MKRILVVEDYADQAETLTLVLKGAGYTVYTAMGGLQAQALADLHPIDAAVVDLRMAGMDGREFIGWLRGRTATAAIPIVLSTAMPPGAVKDLAALPNVKVLQKPYTPDELLAALER